MDISTENSSPTLHRLTIPDSPLSPWLRLAHHSGADLQADVPTRAPLRRLTDFELVLNLQGTPWLYDEAAGGSVDVPPGAIAFIPPGLAHAWSGGGVHLAVHFDLHAEPGMAPMQNLIPLRRQVSRNPLPTVPRIVLCRAGVEDTVPLVSKVRDTGRWLQRLNRLVELATLPRSTACAAEAAGLLGWCLAELVEAAQADDDPAARMQRLLSALAHERGTRPTVAELAARMEMSETLFREIFRRATGSAPHAWLEALRMQRAARMLVESDLPITAIGQAEGYEDPFHFSRAFKRVHGVSPRQYRQGVGEG